MKRETFLKLQPGDEFGSYGMSGQKFSYFFSHRDGDFLIAEGNGCRWHFKAIHWVKFKRKRKMPSIEQYKDHIRKNISISGISTPVIEQALMGDLFVGRVIDLTVKYFGLKSESELRSEGS